MTKKTVCIILACLFILGAWIAQSFGFTLIVAACFIAFCLFAAAALLLDWRDDPKRGRAPPDNRRN